MRAGLAVSVIGHIGAVLITALAWQAHSVLVPISGNSVVPVDIVDIGPESNVRALAMDVEDEAEAPEMTDETQEASAAAPTPSARRPTPPQQQEDDLLNSVQRTLEDRSKQRGQRQQEGETSTRNRAGAGRGTAEQVALEDRAVTLVQNATNRCWRTTADMANPDRLIVVLEVRLDRNGGLIGQPVRIQPAGPLTFDSEMQEAVRRAEQAVRLCDPYSRVAEDPIVGEHYEVWRELHIRFGPRQDQ